MRVSMLWGKNESSPRLCRPVSSRPRSGGRSSGGFDRLAQRENVVSRTRRPALSPRSSSPTPNRNMDRTGVSPTICRIAYHALDGISYRYRALDKLNRYEAGEKAERYPFDRKKAESKSVGEVCGVQRFVTKTVTNSDGELRAT